MEHLPTNATLSAPSLNGSQLKLLAMALMLIDHIGAFLLDNGSEWYPICRSFGRLAFPIFCLMIAEGACHTRSIGKYMARLGAFALLSTPPYSLLHGDKWYALANPNVFFTLLMGLMGIACVKELAPWAFLRMGKPALSQNETACWCVSLPVLTALYFAAYAFHTDYGGYGVAAILLFYLLRRRPAAAWGAFALLTFLCYDWVLVRQYAPGLSPAVVRMNPYELLHERVWLGDYTLAFVSARQMLAPLAFLPASLYNGQRGGSRMPRRLAPYVKYAFYAFYPLHLTVLWLIQRCIGT